MAEYLEWNAQPENATYAYDFFRDNCATKVIAVLEEVFGDRYHANCVATDSTYLEAFVRSRREIRGRRGAWN